MKNQKALSVGFLYDDTLDSSDGVAQYVKTLGAWLSIQGHNVSYLVGETKMTSWAGGKVYSVARNQSVAFNGNRLSMPMPTSSKIIKKLLRDVDFDILHVQVPYSPFMAKHVINHSNTKAIVGTFHIYPSNRLVNYSSRLLKLLLGDSLKKFDSMISVSQPAADFAKKTLGVKSRVIPNMVELDRFRNGFTQQAKNENLIVFLGRLVPRKGCLQLLKAFSLLVKENPDITLIIAGDGPQKQNLKSYVDKNKLSGSVKFLGFVDEADKPKLLSSARIACFPSLSGESFGIVLIEAMAAGAGVVFGGDNPGYKSVLGEKPELLFDPRDANEFAQGLKRLFVDHKLRVKLHDWQNQLVKKYDVETVGPQIIEFYTGAIASAAKRRHNETYAAKRSDR